MFKEKLRVLLENPTSKAFWITNDLLSIIIIAATVLVLLELSPGLSVKYGQIFGVLEFVIVGVFTLEYAAYIYLAKNKLKYLFSFYGIIDLLAIVPTFFFLTNLQFLKSLRIARLLRLFRLLRILKILRTLELRYKRNQATREILKFNIQIYLTTFVILTVVFAIILFEIEQGVPGTQINNVGDAVWSVLSGLSSVGFGNVFPVSFLGRIFMGIVMLTGVGFLSFAILTIGKFFQLVLFGEEIGHEDEELKHIEKVVEKNKDVP